MTEYTGSTYIDSRDQGWIQDMQSGDKAKSDAAFAKLYTEYTPLVLANLKKWVDSPDDRQDILQETFLSVWKAITSPDEHGVYLKIRGLGSYLATATKTRYINWTEANELQPVLISNGLFNSDDDDDNSFSDLFEENMAADTGEFLGSSSTGCYHNGKPMFSVGAEPILDTLIAEETEEQIYRVAQGFPADRHGVLLDFIDGNLTQVEISEKHGIPTSTVGRWVAALEARVTESPAINVGKPKRTPGLIRLSQTAMEEEKAVNFKKRDRAIALRQARIKEAAEFKAAGIEWSLKSSRINTGAF